MRFLIKFRFQVRNLLILKIIFINWPKFKVYFMFKIWLPISFKLSFTIWTNSKTSINCFNNFVSKSTSKILVLERLAQLVLSGPIMVWPKFPALMFVYICWIMSTKVFLNRSSSFQLVTTFIFKGSLSLNAYCSGTNLLHVVTTTIKFTITLC